MKLKCHGFCSTSSAATALRIQIAKSPWSFWSFINSFNWFLATFHACVPCAWLPFWSWPGYYVKRFFGKEFAAVCISVVFCTRRRTVVVVVVVDDFMNSPDSFPASMAQRIALILLPLMTTPPPPQKEPLERALETGRRTSSLHSPRDAQHSFLDARIFFRESLAHSSRRWTPITSCRRISCICCLDRCYVTELEGLSKIVCDL